MRNATIQFPVYAGLGNIFKNISGIGKSSLPLSN